MTKNNSLVLTIDKLTGFAYNVSSDNFLFLSSQDSLNVFENAFLQVRQYLRHFATEPDFLSKMQMAFGDNFIRNSALGLSTAWAKGDFASLPQIEIRSSQEINGALGAFSRDTNRIYLAQEFISKNQSHPEIIAQVLLEEIGHWVDSRINVADAPGDEGEIFSDLVRGQILNDEKLQYLRGKNDVATVVIDGQLIQIEQASTGWVSGGFEGSQKTLKLDSKSGRIVQYSYQMYTIPDNLILRYEGKDILNTGYVSGGKTGTVQIPKGNSDELQVILATNDEGTAWNYSVETINNEVNIKDAYVAVEGGSSKTATIKFTVTLSKASNVATTVQYMTLIGTAVDVDGKKAGKDGIDYQPVKGTVTFAPGETTKDIEITVSGDEPVNYANDKNFEIFARDTAYRDWTGKEGQDIDEKLTDENGNILISPYGDLGYRVNKVFNDGSTDFQAVGLTSDEKFFVLISDPTNAEISKDGDAEKNRLLTELAKDFGADQSSHAYIEAKKQIDKQIDELQTQKASWTFATGTIYDKGKPPVLAVRGTASKLDAIADTQPYGVGFNQFQASQNSDININGWLTDVSKPNDTNISFKPDITGHSLGGALTQWIASDYSAQGSLGDIVTFNSPGIAVTEANNFKGADKVTHYITSTDVVSMAGFRYIAGQYKLSNETFSTFNQIPVVGPHTHPVIIGRTYRTGDDKPSLPPPLNDSVNSLNSPLFTYLPDPDYFIFLLVVSKIPYLGPALAQALKNRATAELSRSIIIGVPFNTAINANDFTTVYATEAVKAAFNAAKQWGEDAWNAVAQWGEDAWSGISDWTSTTWNATINFGKDAWNATIDWGIDQWDGINKWTATAWNATKNWGSDQWNATIHWGSDAWNATANWTSDQWNATTHWTASAWDATTHWIGNLLPFASNSLTVEAVPQVQATQISSPWELYLIGLPKLGKRLLIGVMLLGRLPLNGHWTFGRLPLNGVMKHGNLLLNGQMIYGRLQVNWMVQLAINLFSGLLAMIISVAVLAMTSLMD
ncbi:Calx-beta domain-containing protein [Dolichospermum sp. UHCC 0260]|uniref:Calx-beta domain-containing protein n=1 Tax=unclassified Dolichospermum TaxID=2622029 RepID=UPI0014452C6A|nr:hypothetical protein [Dolichospermum sp. UHCC 0260]